MENLLLTVHLSTEDAFLLSYLLIMFVTSCFVNGVILIVFVKKSTLQTVSNGFVINLIVSETGLIVLLAVFSLPSLLNGAWVYSGMVCRLQCFVFIVILTSIQYTLMVIALDRMVAINRSLRYADIFNRRLAITMISGTWLLGILFGVPVLLGWSSSFYNDALYVCTFDAGRDSVSTAIFTVLVCALPFLIGTICYIRVFRAALKHTGRLLKVWPVPQQSTSNTVQDVVTIETSVSNERVLEKESDKVAEPAPIYTRYHRGTRFKTVKTIMCIASVYLVTWIPFYTVIILQKSRVLVPVALGKFSLAVLMTSGVLKPIVYAIMNRTTRRVLFKCLQSRLPRIFNNSASRNRTIVSTINSYPSTSANNSNVMCSQSKAYLLKATRGTLPVTSNMRTISEEPENKTATSDGSFRIHPYSFTASNKIAVVDCTCEQQTKSNRKTWCDVDIFKGDNILSTVRVSVKPFEAADAEQSRFTCR